MNFLFLPIDIEIPNMDISKIQSTIKAATTATSKVLQTQLANNTFPQSSGSTNESPVEFENAKYQPYWTTSRITETLDDNLKFILDQLPISKVTNIYYKEQKESVSPHYDVYPNMKFEEGEYANILDNEPSGYRLVLEGSTDVLYVKSQGTFKLAELPSVPCCYLLNTTAGLHMLKDDPGRKIIYIRGFIDTARHQTLIEKSLNRYKNLSIIS